MGIKIFQTLIVILKYCWPSFLIFFLYLVLEKMYSIKYYLNTFSFYSKGMNPSIITLSNTSESNSFGGIHLISLTFGINFAVISEADLLLNKADSMYIQIQNLTLLSKESLLFVIILLNFITLLFIWGLSKRVLLMEIFNRINIFSRPYRLIDDQQDRRHIYDVTDREFFNNLKNTENRFRRVLIDIIGIIVLTLNILIFFGQK